MILDILHLMRIHQYIKNLFIFLPAFFGFKLMDMSSMEKSLLAFIIFCFFVSAIYIFNDIIDASKDKLHPKKKFRPIASGRIGIRFASFIAVVLLICGSVGLSFLPSIIIPVCIYLILNLFYSLWLKHIAILDVFIISCGFVLRLFIGSLGIDIYLSEWIIIMTFLLALFLALAKRRDDVILYEESGQKVRASIDGYNKQFLDIAMSVSASIVMIAYILWSISPDVIMKFNSKYLYLTSVFVLAGILRYMQIAFVKENSGSPTKIILKDYFLQLVILAWLLSFLALIYIF